MALAEFARFDSEPAAKRNIRTAIESVASRLGNTTAICRKCYIHPEVLNCYLEGALVKTLSQKIRKELRDDIADLKPEEAATLRPAADAARSLGSKIGSPTSCGTSAYGPSQHCLLSGVKRTCRVQQRVCL